MCRRRWLAAAAAIVLSAGLASCGSITAETGTSTFVAPGRYAVYTCRDIDNRVQVVQKRKAELEQLMGRAAEGPGGSLVNAVAYRSEYLESRDELVELSHASADKQCATQSQWSSGRAVF